MSCELINPRKDLPSIAAELYAALKRKPCDCIWAWTEAGYVTVKQCSGCAAIERWEAITEALR